MCSISVLSYAHSGSVCVQSSSRLRDWNYMFIAPGGGEAVVFLFAGMQVKETQRLMGKQEKGTKGHFSPAGRDSPEAARHSHRRMTWLTAVIWLWSHVNTCFCIALYIVTLVQHILGPDSLSSSLTLPLLSLWLLYLYESLGLLTQSSF